MLSILGDDRSNDDPLLVHTQNTLKTQISSLPNSMNDLRFQKLSKVSKTKIKSIYKILFFLWSIILIRILKLSLSSIDRFNEVHNKLLLTSPQNDRHLMQSRGTTSGSLRGPNAIPLPLPQQKVSVVLMNYSRPRMIRETSLMRTLLSHPNVGEVVLLHANPKTKFEFVHEKVYNLDATQENDELGLSLRFYFCQIVKYDWVIHVDDDMEFTADVITELLIEFNKNPKRIVGRFGRQLGKGNWFNGYSSKNTHKQSDVVLTKLMIMERDMCSSFFEYAHLIWEDIVLNKGEGPLWNGEDIFMSLVANHVYGEKNNYAMDWLNVRNAPNHLKDYNNGKLDISGGFEGLRFWSWEWWQSLLRRNRHYSYRGLLWQSAEYKLASSRKDVDPGDAEGISGLTKIENLKI